MKKMILGAVLALLLATGAHAQLYSTPVVSLNEAQANISGVDASFLTLPAVIVHVYSKNGFPTIGTIYIEAGSGKNNYQTVGQVANPSVGGETWAGPTARYVRCRVGDDYASGKVSCTIDGSYNTALAKTWKRIDIGEGAAPATATPTWTPTVTPTGTRTPTATPTVTPTPR